MLDALFSSKYGSWGCSLHFVILPTSGFTGISDLTKMHSDILNCVVIRRGTFTPHRECPALRIVSGRQVQLLPDRRREGYAAVSDFMGMFAPYSCSFFARPQAQGWGRAARWGFPTFHSDFPPSPWPYP